MSNDIFARLGLAAEATVEEIADSMLLRDGMCLPPPQPCLDMECALCKRTNAIELLRALESRAKEAGKREAWEAMKGDCRKIGMTGGGQHLCYEYMSKVRGVCAFATCPLLVKGE